MSEKKRFPCRMGEDTMRKIDQWYSADNCRSKNEFVEKAVDFYADYLAMGRNNRLLPKAVLSAMDGRLGLLEKRLSAISFNHAVELDMLAGIIEDTYRLDREDLNRRRAQSVKNVKQTNGRISLEKCAQLSEEPDWGEEDEWQS
ncbi:MAG: hypothetical protein IKC03_02525 [Oscillospiraceae bacterium]|nr:hypothetical protein [Oscillospiraceae bacterium]